MLPDNWQRFPSETLEAWLEHPDDLLDNDEIDDLLEELAKRD